MNTTKLSIDFFEEEVKSLLVALHCSLEIHQLAFVINRDFSTYFTRERTDFYDQETQARYALFHWKKTHDETWFLVENQTKEQQVHYGLFNMVEKHSFLIKEHKKANYLLKIDNPHEQLSTEKLIHNLREISQIHFSYPIEISSLKSKYKLIF